MTKISAESSSLQVSCCMGAKLRGWLRQMRRSWTSSCTGAYLLAQDGYCRSTGQCESQTKMSEKEQTLPGSVSRQVKRRGWIWLGHVVRMDQNANPRIALTWEKEKGSPTWNVEKNSGARPERKRLENLGWGSDRGYKQSRLEATTSRVLW